MYSYMSVLISDQTGRWTALDPAEPRWTGMVIDSWVQLGHFSFSRECNTDFVAWERERLDWNVQ